MTATPDTWCRRDVRPLVSFLVLLLRRDNGQEIEDLGHLLGTGDRTPLRQGILGARAIDLANALAPEVDEDQPTPITVLRRAHRDLSALELNHRNDLTDEDLALLAEAKRIIAQVAAPDTRIRQLLQVQP